MKKQDTYKEVKTFTYPNMIVRVHVPDITDDERARRYKRIYAAAAELLKDTMLPKNKKECAT